MATATTDLDGLFKEVYGEGPVNVIPESAKLLKAVSFKQEDKIGDKYVVPVELTMEQGVTYGAPAAGLITLTDAVSMKTKKAEVDGYQIIGRAAMDYETAAKAVKGGAAAFRSATQLQLESMMRSMNKRLEIGLFYGQSGLGKVTSTGSANVDTTHSKVCITEATWATLLWSGMEGATLNFYNSTSLISSSTDAIFTIQKVDVANRTLTVTGTTTGISALDTGWGSYTLDIYFAGAYGSEAAGLQKIITNTGTLFGISADTYNLWKGSSVSASSAQLTLSKLFDAVEEGTARGLDEKATAYVSPKTWANLISDQAALRRFDASFSEEKVKNGAKKIVFFASNGEIEIEPYGLIKRGEAFIVPTSQLSRVGAYELSFKTPGMDDKIFLHLASQGGFEYRSYTDQALFCKMPAKTIYISGIVNS